MLRAATEKKDRFVQRHAVSFLVLGSWGHCSSKEKTAEDLFFNHFSETFNQHHQTLCLGSLHYDEGLTSCFHRENFWTIIGQEIENAFPLHASKWANPGEVNQHLKTESYFCLPENLLFKG